MSSNEKLPEGVGKKIVEALKKQQELEKQSNSVEKNEHENNEFLNEIKEASSSSSSSILANESDVNQPNNQFNEINEIIANETSFEKNIDEPQINVLKEPIQTGWDYNATFEYANDINGDFHDKSKSISKVQMPPPVKEFELPSNVSVLKNLIRQLPSGVTKQTGAQIIRQTLEALGISMTSVLSEAQSVQDDLNDAIRDCMSTIQEYKHHVQTLERQALEYQKQVSNINDLISLFILTDQK